MTEWVTDIMKAFFCLGEQIPSGDNMIVVFLLLGFKGLGFLNV